MRFRKKHIHDGYSIGGVTLKGSVWRGVETPIAWKVDLCECYKCKDTYIIANEIKEIVIHDRPENYGITNSV